VNTHNNRRIGNSVSMRRIDDYFFPELLLHPKKKKKLSAYLKEG
jgi:hypothetical protein